MYSQDDMTSAEDSFLEAELDRALRPYTPLVPGEALALYRELLGDFLTTHPVGMRLLDRARPRPAAARSTDVAKEGADLGREEDRSRRGGQRR